MSWCTEIVIPEIDGLFGTFTLQDYFYRQAPVYMDEFQGVYLYRNGDYGCLQWILGTDLGDAQGVAFAYDSSKEQPSVTNPTWFVLDGDQWIKTNGLKLRCSVTT